jgi:apolipoprotein D and lipocalin family protein|uniref:Lipocalin/cytosolic fatty-acid binding domain-containing protein n=1 Tax=Eutreptiella gymnastica TaxID=73025 RepID=A0A7S4GB07_9EUGL
MGFCCSCLKPELKGVDKVQVPQMLGSWYVVGVIPTPFEKGACNPTEVYTWNHDTDCIDVDFHFNDRTLDGPVKSVPQKLYTGGYPDASGKWLASPIWPLKLDYTIMAVSSTYDWVVVGHRSRSFFWIMARQPVLDQAIIQNAMELGKAAGFDMTKIEFPEHSVAPAAPPAKGV